VLPPSTAKHMNRDPFYQKIIQRLNRTLDPQLFEDCAADLLRSTWPTLVPVRGGSDSGMDGAIADGKGGQFPLITTTSEDVIGNLTYNIKTRSAKGDTTRKAVLATSRQLTPRKRENLIRRAQELGLALLQIHDQADIANRLYHTPKWCRELLGLTGDPAPLSKVPKSERIFLNLPLIGRDTDLAWLRQTSGDKILVGQPGTGKTFLLRQLADLGEALFVNTSDRGAIAEGIREQQPTTLIVDDAQLHHDVLLNLKQLREEIGAQFNIIATCWPSDEHSLAPILNVPSAQIHSFVLLPRDSIVQVIKATGVGGPNQLIHELVNQAEGRPGLAVTLAHLCLQGDIHRVFLGEALADSLLKNATEQMIGVLAAFAIGGDVGMELDVVANELKIPPVEVREYVTKLAASGVILDVSDRQLAIRPPALREALSRDVFFGGATSLGCERLIWRAPSLEQVGLTLIGASRRHARIPCELMIQVLDRSNSIGIWQNYSWLGREEALWVLNNRPGILTVIAHPLLHHAPEVAIPLFLEQAIGDDRPLNAAPDHPHRLIGDWVKSAYPGTGAAVKRRQVLLDTTTRWLKEGKNVNVGLLALTYAFSPQFKTSETDPGEGRAFHIRFGFLTLEELRFIQNQWPQALSTLQHIQIDDTEPLRQLITEYAYQYRYSHGHTVPEEIATAMESFAERMLRDLVVLFNQRADVAYWAKPLATHLNLALDLHLDREFDILYPTRESRDWKEEQEHQRQEVETLATEWSQLAPETVAQKLASVEAMAKRIKARWSEWSRYLCERVAGQVVSPLTWAQALAQTTEDGSLVLPFLKCAALLSEVGWVEWAEQCLANPSLRFATILTVLTQIAPPQSLLNLTLANLSGFAQLTETLVVRKEIPEDTLRQLLRHSDSAIAGAAAQGEWMSDPQGTVRDSLREDWRNAILRFAHDGYWLRQILISDPTLARAWLERHIANQPLRPYEPDSVVGGAIAVTSEDERIRLLDQIPDSFEMDHVIFALVNDHLQVYRALLNNERLKDFHLVPLGNEIKGNWVEKAKMALDQGYSAQKVAQAARGYQGFISWEGNESNMWGEWIGRYNSLLEDSDQRIRIVGEIGKAYAEERRSRALECERREAVYGRE